MKQRRNRKNNVKIILRKFLILAINAKKFSLACFYFISKIFSCNFYQFNALVQAKIFCLFIFQTVDQPSVPASPVKYIKVILNKLTEIFKLRTIIISCY